MHAALLLLALAQAPSPRWTLHVNSQDWCASAPGPKCALREVSLDDKSAPAQLPGGAPWQCTVGEVKQPRGRFLRTVSCTTDGGKSAVRATAELEGANAAPAELGLDWKDDKGRHHSASLQLVPTP